MAFDARVEEGRSFTKTVVLDGLLDSLDVYLDTIQKQMAQDDKQ